MSQLEAVTAGNATHDNIPSEASLLNPAAAVQEVADDPFSSNSQGTVAQTSTLPTELENPQQTAPHQPSAQQAPPLQNSIKSQLLGASQQQHNVTPYQMGVPTQMSYQAHMYAPPQLIPSSGSGQAGAYYQMPPQQQQWYQLQPQHQQYQPPAPQMDVQQQQPGQRVHAIGQPLARTSSGGYATQPAMMYQQAYAPQPRPAQAGPSGAAQMRQSAQFQAAPSQANGNQGGLMGLVMRTGQAAAGPGGQPASQPAPGSSAPSSSPAPGQQQSSLLQQSLPQQPPRQHLHAQQAYPQQSQYFQAPQQPGQGAQSLQPQSVEGGLGQGMPSLQTPALQQVQGQAMHPGHALQHLQNQQATAYSSQYAHHQGYGPPLGPGAPVHQLGQPMHFIPPGSAVIQPGTTPYVPPPSSGDPNEDAQATAATRQLVGSRKRRSGQPPPTKDDIQQSGSSESWSFLPGTTKTGKRRRRHPVAEVKGNWTPEEDAKLMELVKKHGVGCWSKLLPEFQGRIGKQLRERWNHELRPDINKEGWTHDEERMLVEAHKNVGNSWAEIAKVLPGRTQNGVKNHWHATMRKVSRAPQYANPSTPLQAYLREINNGGIQPPSNKKGEALKHLLPGASSSAAAQDDGNHAESAERAKEDREESTDDENPDAGEKADQDGRSSGRAVGKRTKMARVANDDFHLQLQSRSLSPEAQTATKKRRKRLNAEELAVADGLLGLQEANNAGSDETASQESSPPPGARRRRPSAKAMAAHDGGNGAGKKKGLKQRRLSFPEGSFRGLGELGGSAREGSGEGIAPGSFLAMIANAAVAVDGLKRVGATQCGSAEEEMVQTALESPQLSKLRRYLAYSGQPDNDSKSGGEALNSIIKRFTELPDLWTLYDVLKQDPC